MTGTNSISAAGNSAAGNSAAGITAASISAAAWGRALFAWDSLLLFLICTADMCSTLYWVHTGAASEANPWMAFCLAHGDAAFVAAKFASFLPLLAFAAFYRARRPRLIAISLRGTVALYAAVYLIAVGGQWI